MTFYDKDSNIVYRQRQVGGKSLPSCLCKPSLTNDQYCAEVDRISHLLKNNIVHLQVGNFEEAIIRAAQNDFVILNPPYPENERSTSGHVGLDFELYSKEELHKKISRLIEKLEDISVAYLMSYGLYNPNLRSYVIESSYDWHNRYFRLIGSKKCVFGVALDQIYLTSKYYIPQSLSSKIIRSNDLLPDETISHEAALGKFIQMSTKSSTSFRSDITTPLIKQATQAT